MRLNPPSHSLRLKNVCSSKSAFEFGHWRTETADATQSFYENRPSNTSPLMVNSGLFRQRMGLSLADARLGMSSLRKVVTSVDLCLFTLLLASLLSDSDFDLGPTNHHHSVSPDAALLRTGDRIADFHVLERSHESQSLAYDFNHPHDRAAQSDTKKS